MALKHIPGVERATWRKLMRKKWLVELISSVPPLVIGSIGAYRLAQDSTTDTLGKWSFGAVSWLVIASLIKVFNARETDEEDAAKLNHDGITAAMLVLQASAGHACGLDPSNLQTVRATFHRVMPPLNNAQEIEQLVPYCGGDGGGEGRRFSVRSGITGRCIRVKQLYIMHRPDSNEDAYRRSLEEDWGYTKADASQLSTGKLSCMAVPVLDDSGKHALGVIYLDSEMANMFESTEVQTAIFEACAGVTRYVTERYGK